MRKPIKERETRIRRIHRDGQAVLALHTEQLLTSQELAELISKMFGVKLESTLKSLEYDVLPFLLNKEITLPNGNKTKIVKQIDKKYALFTYREALRRLEKPDLEKLRSILQRLDKATTHEAYEVTLKDFVDLCSHTRIWEYESMIWPVFKKHLIIRSKDLIKILTCLSNVIKNIVESGEKGTFQTVKKQFFRRVKVIYKKSLTGEPLGIHKSAPEILKVLGTEDEKIKIFKDALKEVIKNEDVNFSNIGGFRYIGTLLDFELNEVQKEELRNWFFKLLESKSSLARKKASDAYEALFGYHGQS